MIDPPTWNILVGLAKMGWTNITKAFRFFIASHGEALKMAQIFTLFHAHQLGIPMPFWNICIPLVRLPRSDAEQGLFNPGPPPLVYDTKLFDFRTATKD